MCAFVKFSGSAWGFGAVLPCKYKQVSVKPAVYEVLYEQVYAMLLKEDTGYIGTYVHTASDILKRNLPAVLGLAASVSFC